MDVNELIEQAAEVVRAIPEMADQPVIEVHKGDVAKNLEIAIAKTRFAVLVGWNGFKAKSNSSKTIVGDANLVVELFERPVVSSTGGGLKLLPAARLVGNAVNLSQPPGQSPIVFREITPVTEPSPGLISCNVIFAANNTTL